MLILSVLSDRGLNSPPQQCHNQSATGKVTQTTAGQNKSGSNGVCVCIFCVFSCLNLTQLKGGPEVRLVFQFHFHPLTPPREGGDGGGEGGGETLPGKTWAPPHCDVSVFPWRHEAGVGGAGWVNHVIDPEIGHPPPSPPPPRRGSVPFLSALTQMGSEPFKLVDRPIAMNRTRVSDGKNIDCFLVRVPELTPHVY